MYSGYINVKRRLNMKVLLLNGSPNVNGNTARALEEMRKIFEEEQIETEVIQIGSKQIAYRISYIFFILYHTIQLWILCVPHTIINVIRCLYLRNMLFC